MPKNLLKTLKAQHLISHDIAPILSDIFSESFIKTGTFPDHMKLAMISPIFKGGSPIFKGGSRLEVSNYRPASVSSILRKLLKRLMQSRLTKFLDENKIIYEHQFGFQKNKGATLAVLDLYSETLKALEKHEYACSVFLGFAKAFDAVDHNMV